MKTLTKEQVLYLHAELIEEFGGTDGIRDMGLLESAMYAPFQSAEKLFTRLYRQRPPS